MSCNDVSGVVVKTSLPLDFKIAATFIPIPPRLGA
jgi:hypothetical protein